MTTLSPTAPQLHARTASPARVSLASARAAGGVVANRRTRAAHLILGDAAAITAAVLVAGAPLLALLLVPAALTALSTRGLYCPRVTSALDSFAAVLTAATMAAGALLLAATAIAPSALPAAPLAHAWLLGCVLLVAHRATAMIARPADAGAPTVVFGAGGDARILERALQAHPDAGLCPVAVINVDLDRRRRTDDSSALANLAVEHGAQQVVIAPGGNSDAAVARLARACAARGLGVAVRTAIGDAGGALEVEQAGPVSLVRVKPVDTADPRFAVKHAIDRGVAGLALLAIAPLFLFLAAAVRLSSPGPALFRQRRIGRDGREFDMLKFRSMRPADPAEDAVATLRAGAAPGGVEGIDRRTTIGRILRRTSLDELPQLLNVLRGDMSLVGPRPERPEFVDRFSRDIDRYADRHRLKSGMTGLSQVKGLRGKTSIADRVAYDNHYVEHWSLGLDLKILLRTARAVFQPAE